MSNADAKQDGREQAAVEAVYKARGNVWREAKEAECKAKFLESIYGLVASARAPGNCLASDLYECVDKSDTDSDQVSDFFQCASQAELGLALESHKGFATIEFCDGLDGVSGELFLAILSTMEATVERKILLRDALLTREIASRDAARAKFFQSLNGEAIIDRIREMK